MIIFPEKSLNNELNRGLGQFDHNHLGCRKSSKIAQRKLFAVGLQMHWTLNCATLTKSTFKLTAQRCGCGKSCGRKKRRISLKNGVVWSFRGLIFGGWVCFQDGEGMRASSDQRWLLRSRGPGVGLQTTLLSLSTEIREEEVQAVEDGVFDIHL